MKSKADRFVKEEFMRYLEQDTGPIAGVGLAATRATMLHVFKDGESIRNMLM